MFFIKNLDNISYVFINLTSIITFICILSIDTNIKSYKSYVSSLFIIEQILWILFTTDNLLLFYITFEMLLFPLLFLIIKYGSGEKITSAIHMLLFTVFGSIFMLASILFIYKQTGSFLIKSIADIKEYKDYLFFGLLIACLVKIPVLPFHSWLPRAHVDSETTTSMILASLILKTGGYALIKIIVPYFDGFDNLLVILGTCSMIYASIAAFYQNDTKKIIAYSSIAHMGFVLCGAYTCLSGVVFHMISHAFISAGLFFAIGIIYKKFGSRNLDIIKDIQKQIPRLNCCFLILCLANIALPGTSGFVGEILIILNLHQTTTVAFFIALGVVLSCIYTLNLYKDTLQSSLNGFTSSVSNSEFVVLFLLTFSVIILGLFPSIILKNI